MSNTGSPFLLTLEQAFCKSQSCVQLSVNTKTLCFGKIFVSRNLKSILKFDNQVNKKAMLHFVLADNLCPIQQQVTLMTKDGVGWRKLPEITNKKT